MGVETSSQYPFSVDTWTEFSKRKPFHFLTHAHKDHTGGIESHGTFPIYCTPLTQKLVCGRYPKLNPSIFKFLEVGEARYISNEDEGFTVTAYDANHCPGSRVVHLKIVLQIYFCSVPTCVHDLIIVCGFVLYIHRCSHVAL